MPGLHLHEGSRRPLQHMLDHRRKRLGVWYLGLGPGFQSGLRQDHLLILICHAHPGLGVLSLLLPGRLSPLSLLLLFVLNYLPYNLL